MSASATPSLRFSEQTLTDLLRALRARAVSHPDNPGLIAFWPTVDERRMAAACAELVRLGYPVQRVLIAGWQGGKSRSGWALGANELEPS
jgi:hypothetical protein